VDLGSRGTVSIVTLPALLPEQLRKRLKGGPQLGKA
jgi:hypothetical protein